jgi:hypothetical protein
MLKYTLPTGRTVELTTLHIQTAVPPVARESKEDRRAWAQLIEGLVRQYYGPDVGYNAVWPDGTIPRYLCIGSFVAMPDSLDGYFEPLPCQVLCWFVWHIERQLAEIVEEGLMNVNPTWP